MIPAASCEISSLSIDCWAVCFCSTLIVLPCILLLRYLQLHATLLGQATFASGLSPDEAFILYKVRICVVESALCLAGIIVDSGNVDNFRCRSWTVRDAASF